ncbi:MAG: ShlB/FhaC/HecB family hemolysin secretion/activation protein [Tychonema bourrellyi B0820]|uniref:ShlB/FhaC/HecB family hemolysin secretion/activation protein n=1 Tax=Tychonema bourrellyi FEM_GT703 TaxID=2040638 RepID=A0A2G4EY96_9CYAN|nr:ShlB/FhaC/HecB family hemolysin secretion/activation protein [Tychonema bourrellyi]MDQ2100552.1 ShlB/FhaC/HecB family hemolysin secretion/activation protein [Tychonema bourrellyi B0820]PHX54502.1 ShlB/FhaC/HecB family hemolysin secretion/activation protein [Tychonema bourrellyi FEM_GT703]
MTYRSNKLLIFIVIFAFLLLGIPAKATASKIENSLSNLDNLELPNPQNLPTEIDRDSQLISNPVASVLFNPSTVNSQQSTVNEISQLPNPIQPREPELPAPGPPQPPELSPLQPTQPTPAEGEVRPEIPGTIRVDRFEFEGNTAFSDRELAEITQTFVGREITFAELIAVEAAVTQKYLAAGYINSGAVIPANQSFPRQGAVVKIQIVEGGLEEIVITGNRRLNASYVRSRLAIATKKPLNRDRLLQALQLLQLDPLIANISAELQAGSSPEKSRLEVRVKEADSFSGEVFTDNNRSPSVGSFRRGVRINQANLLGLGDGLEVSYANTDGSNEINGSYTIPVNPRNGTIRLAVGAASTNIIEEPFDAAGIEGKSRTYELSYRQPIVEKPDRNLALGVTLSRQESNTSLSGEPFPLSAGANDRGETRVSAVRFFQEYVQRSSNQVFAARSQFSIGTNLFGATSNNSGPNSRFLAWRGQAQYVRLLAPETLLIVRSDIQLADRPLLSLEQIGIGGVQSVRGYRQDLLLTDSGAIASAEVRIPIWRVPKVKGLLQVAPFIDLGVGWNHSGEKANPDSDKLLGAGVGLLWQMGDRFNARLDYGIPLINVGGGDRTFQEKGIYFRINYFAF